MRLSARFLFICSMLCLGSCGAVRLVPPEEMGFGSRERNLDFEGGTHARGVPEGWSLVRGRGGGKPEEYRFEVVGDTKRSGRASLRIKFAADKPRGGGSVIQCLRDPLLGALRLVGYLKVLQADEGGSLWLRADSAEGKSVAFQNMDGRRVRGSTDWEQHSVQIVIPNSARQICFGVFLTGAGTLWADDLSFR